MKIIREDLLKKLESITPGLTEKEVNDSDCLLKKIIRYVGITLLVIFLTLTITTGIFIVCNIIDDSPKNIFQEIKQDAEEIKKIFITTFF